MELGWIYPKRKKLIEESISTPSSKTYPVNFQGGLQYLNVYTIPIGMPKYRLNNGRTYADQAEYLAKNPNLSKDFFTADPESDVAISIQHELLKKMLQGEKNKEILDYFKNNKQEEPLYLTREGFVLNGNRRLCAMRELLESDSTTYNHFEYISVVILPPAEEKEIDELEARLQIRKDIKAEYSWVTFALMLRRRQEEHGYTADKLAELYEMKSNEINELIDMLSYAEDYLQSRGCPGEYHRIVEAKYAFQQIRKKRSKFFKEDERDLFEKISFALIDNPEGGRLYELIPKSADYLEKITDQIRIEYDLPPTEQKMPDDDILGRHRSEGYIGLEDTLGIFDDEKNLDNVREIIKDIIRGEELKEQEKKRKNFVMNQIRKANSALIDAVVAVSSKTPKTGVQEQISAIEASLEKLRSWLNG